MYEENDCNLSSSTDTTGCDIDKWQMFLWTQEDTMDCDDWENKTFNNDPLG